MDVRLPDGTVIKNVPDGMSKADFTAKLKANGYDISKLDAPAPAPSEIPAPRRVNPAPAAQGLFETIGAPLESMSQGVSKSIGDIVYGGQKLVGMGLEKAGDVFAPSPTLSSLVTNQKPTNVAQQAGQFLQRDAAMRQAQEEANIATYKQRDPFFTSAGELGAQVAATYPVGGWLGQIATRIPFVASLAPSITSGGFKTGTAYETAKAIETAAKLKGVPVPPNVAAEITKLAALGNVGYKATGGAITGGATAALINPEATDVGAATGASVAVVAPPVVKTLAKSAGFLKDAFTGQLVAVKAGQISREMAGDQIGAIRAALMAAPADLTAAQATAGVQRNAFQALGAFAAKTDDISMKLKQQAANDLVELQTMAESGNATQARAAYENSIKRLNQLTADLRNVELQAANQANQTINQLAPQQQQRQASMVNALRGGIPVGQPLPGQAVVSPATEAAQQAATAAKGKPGFLSAADRAQEWQQTSDVFADIAKQRRAEAGFLERQIGSLEDYGLRPLDANPIVAAIEAKLTTPGIRASSNTVKVLEAVRDDIANLTAKGGGVIDAHDLYTLRKEGINERIMQILGQTDPKVSAKVTRQMLSELRPMIDDAIEKAGGTGWRDYLKTYAQGRQQIDQNVMAAQAAKLFKDSPKEYVRLVRGDNTDAVEAIFGPGSYDIFKEMSSKMPTLEKLAKGIEREVGMAEAAGKGSDEFRRILAEKGQTFPRFRNVLSRPVTIVNLTSDELEKLIGPKIAEKLQQGMLSGKSALEMLNTLPSVEKSKLLKALTDPTTWGKMGAATTRGAAASAAPATISATNALAPEQENQNNLR